MPRNIAQVSVNGIRGHVSLDLPRRDATQWRAKASARMRVLDVGRCGPKLLGVTDGTISQELGVMNLNW